MLHWHTPSEGEEDPDRDFGKASFGKISPFARFVRAGAVALCPIPGEIRVYPRLAFPLLLSCRVEGFPLVRELQPSQEACVQLASRLWAGAIDVFG